MSQPLCEIFGVRHLSPAAAHHLEDVLNSVRPTAVLVEGPADATEQIKHLVHKDTRPPLAVLAYTRERPVRSILYPLAEYSPEWVALTWGIRNKAETRFIDLPASVFLELHQITKEPEEESETPQAEPAADGEGGSAKRRQLSEHTRAYLDDPWEEIARLAGEPDHETWWERHFEHTTEPAAYVRSIFEFGRGLRELRELSEESEDLIREAYMRRCIREVLTKHKPEKVLVVCGAFHASALTHEMEPMTDRQVKALPRVDSSLTLMPYSYYRLSSQSGYGAGNHAPAYFQRLFEERRAGTKDRLGSRFFAEMTHLMRRAGHVRSAAEVIEAVRLAHSLAALAGAHAPCLRDLRDAAITCLGRGEAAAVAEFLKEVEVGSQIGKLPKGISRTAIQDDFYMQLESLKLEKYQTEKAQELELDLRENRFVKTQDAAFRDRYRSIFLHRLRTLGIDFGALKERPQAGTAREKWELKWTPDCEIQLVEAALKGDTVEMAAAARLADRLAECERVDQAAELVKEAANCELADALDDARRHLQAMAVVDSALDALAKAMDSLAEIIAYGTARRFDSEPLKPLLAQLFLRATLQIRQACVCDDPAARGISDEEENARRSRQRQHDADVFQPGEFGVRRAIIILNRIAFEHASLVDAERWSKELEAIAASDSLNAFLSGFACALLLERNSLSEDELAREVGRRLSPGIDAELGAGWFEGLVSYNRQALFSRLALWRQLDTYLMSLDDDEFRRALVYLRRAFSDFAPAEVRRVVDNLKEIGGEGAEELAKAVESKLDDEEAKKLQELLGDFGL